MNPAVAVPTACLRDQMHGLQRHIILLPWLEEAKLEALLYVWNVVPSPCAGSAGLDPRMSQASEGPVSVPASVVVVESQK